MTPERFLSLHRVFTRHELIDSDPKRAVATVERTLTRWRAEGRIEPVKRGLYVRLDGAGDLLPDFALIAARLAPDAAAAYHTALEVFGCAQSAFERFSCVTWSRVKAVAFRGRRIVPVRPRAALRTDGGEPWIERREHDGLVLRVTSIERTIVDVLDRPDISGGIEEVWRSLRSVPAIDPVALLAYVHRLGSARVAARVGYYLDSRREELAVPESTLRSLREMAPLQPVFMERRLGGECEPRWRVIVPRELTEPSRGLNN
ncbi:MAG: hypothetical protein KF724_11670 [Phycisphaeraceae bacterium]|nr:hypothetical protein [Phycisphaeraceae bacterium]